MKLELLPNLTSSSPEELFLGRIEFSQEEREGDLPECIEVTGTTCLEPTCGCGEVCLSFPSLDPSDTSDTPRLLVLFTEDKIAKAEFKDSPDRVFRLISQKFPALVTEEHWKAVCRLYRETRTRIAETCDVTSFEVPPDYLSYIAENPDEDDHEASLRDLFVFPFDTGDIDGTTWIFEEFYPVPHTPVAPWVTLEFRTTVHGLVPDLTDDQLELVAEDADSVPELHSPTLCFRWNLDTEEIVEVKRIKTDLPASRFLELLLSVHPDARERFRSRHQHLIDSIARIGSPPFPDLPASLISGRVSRDDLFLDDDPSTLSIPLTREAPKVGRNDPCPCGSGKKFKKCCGA